MFLDEATDLCRQRHRLAPFCNFNGNTFAALAGSLVDTLRLKADEAHIIRSLAGHIVAGTASDMEAKEFVKFGRSLTDEQLKKRSWSAAVIGQPPWHGGVPAGGDRCCRTSTDRNDHGRIAAAAVWGERAAASAQESRGIIADEISF
jgi:hypothetical protein